MRRMHDKTQVLPLTTDDNIHSRLTHSLEVMSVGHSLGLRLCMDTRFVRHLGKTPEIRLREIPVILKSACLVHDIGNPPFGHFGESVIGQYFKTYFKQNKHIAKLLSKAEKEDFIHFDGNAQGFRVLTKLQVKDDAFGLNLTYATLAAYLKYPNCGPLNDKSIAHKKRGAFQSERRYLNEIANRCKLKKRGKIIRHPLTFLVEAADSICYLVMDVEDGFNKGWYDFEEICNSLSKVQGLGSAIEKLRKKHVGYGSKTSRMVELRIYLISLLIDLAIDTFVRNYANICAGKYNSELIDEGEQGLAEALYAFCRRNIFKHREVQSLELTGHSVLTGLLDHYTKFMFHDNKKYREKARGLISESIIRAAIFENKLSQPEDFEMLRPYYKLRIIVDFISGMTDQFALNHYQKLSGQKII